jgi:hypothetical protein
METDQIVLMALSAIGGVMFLMGAWRAWRRGTRGLVMRHEDGSALTFEEKKAQSTGFWRAIVDPAHRGDLALMVGGVLVSSGLLAPVWWGIKALTG